MRRRPLRTLGLAVCGVVFGLGFGCAGLLEGGAECCTVDDIVAMHGQGVSNQVMIDAIRTAGRDLALSADDLTRLDAAGVDATVIDVLNGGPCVCAAPEETPAAAAAPSPKANGLRLRVVYKGGRTLEVVNLSSTTYTGVTVLLNGEYQYQLKRLPAGKTDVMRYGSFRSTRTGKELKKGKLQSVRITAKQGAYSQTF